MTLQVELGGLVRPSFLLLLCVLLLASGKEKADEQPNKEMDGIAHESREDASNRQAAGMALVRNLKGGEIVWATLKCNCHGSKYTNAWPESASEL
jgi:hypothetical protein